MRKINYFLPPPEVSQFKNFTINIVIMKNPQNTNICSSVKSYLLMNIF